jgi:hypothetical protein
MACLWRASSEPTASCLPRPHQSISRCWPNSLRVPQDAAHLTPSFIESTFTVLLLGSRQSLLSIHPVAALPQRAVLVRRKACASNLYREAALDRAGHSGLGRSLDNEQAPCQGRFLFLFSAPLRTDISFVMRSRIACPKEYAICEWIMTGIWCGIAIPEADL